MIKRYKTDLDSTIVEPKVCLLVHPGLCIKNTESIFSLPLSNENITAIKSYQYIKDNFSPHYWISDEQVETKNEAFNKFVEINIKKVVVEELCKNFNVEEFSVRLLGVCFCDSTCFIGQSGLVSTDPVVLQPSSIDVALQRNDFENFCATVCIQVDAIIVYSYCYVYSYLSCFFAAAICLYGWLDELGDGRYRYRSSTRPERTKHR